MTTATIGYGSTVSIGRLSTGANPEWVYTELDEVKDLTLPEAQADEIEVTSMQSPNRAKEFISGLADSGEVSFSMNWTPGNTTDTLLKAIRASGETVRIQFDIVGFTEPETYSGFLKNLTRAAPVSGSLEATATFRISGLVTDDEPEEPEEPEQG